jgi:hypothetical protein
MSLESIVFFSYPPSQIRTRGDSLRLEEVAPSSSLLPFFFSLFSSFLSLLSSFSLFSLFSSFSGFGRALGGAA